MDATYIPRTFETNIELLRSWVPYVRCSISNETFVCSCGAKLKPVLKYANQDGPTKTLYYQLAVRLNQHLKTNKHSHSLQRIVGFSSYLDNKFDKKNTFSKLLDEYNEEECAV